MAANFGTFFLKKRKALKKTLREFCRENGFDAGNLSKIERGIATPPQGKKKRLQYANAIGIQEGTDEWIEFCDLATIAAGKIPGRVVSDKALMNAMPVFFRSIDKEGVSEETIRELMEALRKEI